MQISSIKQPLSRDYLSAKLPLVLKVALIASLFYQLFFCFLNTHFISVSRAHLIIFEAALLLPISILFLLRSNNNLLIIALFIFANCFLLSTITGHFDPKHIRNYLIPLLALWLGSQNASKVDWDKLLIYVATSIIFVGLFEGFLPDSYQSVLNILSYQVKLGLADSETAQYMESSFGLNGVRVWGRTFFGFLFGNHRISSIFLESASMTNAGVMISAWGLSKSNHKQLIKFLCIGIFIVLLSDSRFGSTIIVSLILARFLLSSRYLTIFSFMMPLFIIILSFLLRFYYYDEFIYEDNFLGRISLTAEFLTNFHLSEFFGAYNVNYASFLDSGYAYVLHNYGVVFALVMWTSLFMLKMRSDEGVRYKSLICIVISANFAIGGDALYALKVSFLIWAFMGALTYQAEK